MPLELSVVQTLVQSVPKSQTLVHRWMDDPMVVRSYLRALLAWVWVQSMVVVTCCMERCFVKERLHRLPLVLFVNSLPSLPHLSLFLSVSDALGLRSFQQYAQNPFLCPCPAPILLHSEAHHSRDHTLLPWILRW